MQKRYTALLSLNFDVIEVFEQDLATSDVADTGLFVEIELKNFASSD